MRRMVAIAAVAALTLVSCGGGDNGSSGTDASGGLTGVAAAGEDVFASTCAACHGPDAAGLEGLGKDLHNNVFVDSLTDDGLVDFLKVGRPAGDPANDTGVDMPPRGGNPSLSDQDLYDVAAFLRTLD